jgi:hypothetical protein
MVTKATPTTLATKHARKIQIPAFFSSSVVLRARRERRERGRSFTNLAPGATQARPKAVRDCRSCAIPA